MLATPKARPIAMPIMLSVMMRSRLVARNGIGQRDQLGRHRPVDASRWQAPWRARPRTRDGRATMPDQRRDHRRTGADKRGVSHEAQRICGGCSGVEKRLPRSPLLPLPSLGLSNQGNDINWASRHDPALASDVAPELGECGVAGGGDPDQQADQHAERAACAGSASTATPSSSGTISATAMRYAHAGELATRRLAGRRRAAQSASPR